MQLQVFQIGGSITFTTMYNAKLHPQFTHVSHDVSGGTVMMIAHAASLDVCTRQIVGMPPRNHTGFHDVLHKIPYLALAVCQEDCIIQVRHFCFCLYLNYRVFMCQKCTRENFYFLKWSQMRARPFFFWHNMYPPLFFLQNKWAIVEPPVLSFAHTNNPKYNWAVLTSHFQLWYQQDFTTCI